MKVFFIGHCTFRLTLDDRTVLLTDPWFKYSQIWRLVPPAITPDKVGPVHYVLSSHNHLDHIDQPSLDLVKNTKACLIGSERVQRRALKSGINNAIKLSPGETKTYPGFSVQATPAFHPLAKDAIGFLIKHGGKQIYFSGDTRFDARLVAFLREAGVIDLAFLQVACAHYLGLDDGLDLRTASELARGFNPRVVVPMHLHARFKKEADVRLLQGFLFGSDVQVKIMELGEEWEAWK